MNTLQGQLIVANPKLPDDNFFKTVVLTFTHDDEGGFGVVLNRPTNLTVGKLWKESYDHILDCDSKAFWGGPVPGPPLALHRNALMAEKIITEDLYLAVQKENVERVIQSEEAHVNVYLGYSGWGPGQLEQEMEAGGWLIGDSKTADVFGDQSEMWKSVASKIGQKIMFPTNSSNDFPIDPSLN